MIFDHEYYLDPESEFESFGLSLVQGNCGLFVDLAETIFCPVD